LSFFQIDGSNAGGDLSHLGGALMGFLYVQQLKKGNDFGQPIISFINFVKSLFVRKPKIKVSYKSSRMDKKSGTQARSERAKSVPQDEIDAILDKISEGGYESLTKEEKEKLFNASKK
jgi:hypothetical protein